MEIGISLRKSCGEEPVVSIKGGGGERYAEKQSSNYFREKMPFTCQRKREELKQTECEIFENQRGISHVSQASLWRFWYDLQ